MATPVALISLLLVAAVSLLIIRAGSVALVMTGMARDVASFQASSAFSGAGFTTDEAERALATPERRAIVKTLIRAGSIGIVTAVASLALWFTQINTFAGPRVAYLVIGAVVLGAFARSRWFNRLITPGIEWALNRTTSLEFRDYTHLLEFQEDYRVAELEATDNDWLAGGSLGSLDLDAEGVMILGINRQDGSYISPPDPDYTLQAGDTLTVYGKKDRLVELAGRKEDDETAHDEAVEDHGRDDANRFQAYS